MEEWRCIVEKLMYLCGTHVKTMEEIKGGLTNKTFLVSDGEKQYIARIAGPNTEYIINRNNELQNMQVGEKLGISPTLYAHFDGNYLLEYIPAPTIKCEQDLMSDCALDYVVDVIYQLNTSGAILGEKYSILKNINTYRTQLASMGIDYPPEVIANEQMLYQATEAIEKGSLEESVACHIDNIFGNIFLLPDRALLIDWEYSGMASVYNELANFALLNDMSEDTERLFLNRYFQRVGKECNLIKYYYHKMANNYMWVYWHLIQLHQGANIPYNQRRWRERLTLALACKRKCEVLSK